MELTAGQIATLLNGEIEGDNDLKISRLSKIEEGKTGSISFLANLKYESFIYETESSAVIVNKTFEAKKAISATLIRVENAYSAFTQLLEQYEKIVKYNKSGVEQPSHVGAGTSIGTGGYRGAFSYIGKNCTIGNDVLIYPQAYIGDNVRVGNGTVLHAGVKIYDNTHIGNHCRIFANVVIGSDGFGFAPQPDGSYRTIPQLGNVVIEDHVSIGANTTIDCATMGSTIIRQGVKIDNLVQIAHNVEIGKNTVIASQTGIAGSSKIGENCVFAGQIGIAGHVTVANRTQVGAQSGVNRDIKKEGLSLNGTPVIQLKDSLRSLAVLRRLPELERRILELEKQLKDNIH